jgi:predicted transcriptional regulator
LEVVDLTCILLSIKPKFVEAMMKNEKHYEFRKSMFSHRNIKRVYIYATVPVKMITASFRIGFVEKGTPEELWERFGHVAGILEEEFFEYFRHKFIGYAIKIEDFQSFDEPIDPYEVCPNFTPLQSFQYVDSIENLIQE